MKSDANPRSLNYALKKKEAERIDKENQKIMERIVSQGPRLSTKQMQKDYQDTLRYKRMKEKSLAVSVEKLLEKKRKMQEEAKANLLPTLVS